LAALILEPILNRIYCPQYKPNALHFDEMGDSKWFTVIFFKTLSDKLESELAASPFNESLK